MAKRKSPDNQIVKAEPLPEYGELISIMQSEAASSLTDYIRQYIGAPIPGSGIFTNFDRVGNTQSYQELAWYDLYAEVERDPHVKAILDSAKINVAGIPWDVSAYVEPGAKKPTSRNQAIADFVKDCLDKIGFFPQHLFNMMGALGMGFSVSEIVWEIGDGVRPKTLLDRPPRRFQFDAVTRALKVRTVTAPYMGESLPDRKFIVHRCSNQWENPFGDAIDQSLYWMWLFKRTVTKFWMQHLQVGVASVPIVSHPVGVNKEVKAEALEIAKMIRNGAYGRCPENFKIAYAEAQQGADNAATYQDFERFCDDQMSKAVNGQTLTAEAGSDSGKGTQALGNVHQGTQTARDVFRAHGLEATINASLVKWVVDFNFASVDGYPQFRFDLEDPEDLGQEAAIIKQLSDAGYEFDVAELSEKFNYILTKKQPLNLKPAIEPGKEPEEPELEENEDEQS